MSKRIIGLTGFYCAGKNHVAEILVKRGFAALDVDKLGHKVIEREQRSIVERFGNDIVKDGRVNHRLLGEKVFGKPMELAVLEAIIHPCVNTLIEDWVEKNENCIINAALLHRTSIFPRLDAIIVVKAPLLIRLIRAKRRDRLSWISIFSRFKSQNFSFCLKSVRKNAENKETIYIINNSGRKPQKQIDKVVEALNYLLPPGE
ncbi:MAG: dephospho-CoA kinase [Treponema sp.]|jgi:dephospho-CoA kinase|nr:dephospho-CoA kinase [Treponema sp.]